MPTLLTDPRSGGTAKSSGVKVDQSVAQTWSQVRDDSTPTNWLIASFDGTSKTDVTVVASGSGAWKSGCSPMQRGRASMYKNGVLNVLEGCDREIEMKPGLTESMI
ncbi:hypothetical protein HJC23_005365 [Cyclotella cryptica]|uniref:Uncharacterized protein n=1 Tax=Cyclotella cryptica TaxID=29204 RepID=A0ABD3NPF6_9STRA